MGLKPNHLTFLYSFARIWIYVFFYFETITVFSLLVKSVTVSGIFSISFLSNLIQPFVQVPYLYYIVSWYAKEVKSLDKGF